MVNVRSLKPRQLTAIQLLAVGTPANQVAARLEVSTMTLYRWQRLPEFEARLHSIANSGLEKLTKKMNSTALTAVEVIQEILCDMRQPAALQVKAALGMLNAMASVNGALEKGLQHRAADFDLRKRFSDMAFTYDSAGNLCQPPRGNSNLTNGGVMSDEMEV